MKEGRGILEAFFSHRFIMRLTAQGVACCAPTGPRTPARRPYGRRALRIAYPIIPFQPNGGVFVGAQHATPSRPQGEACS